MPNSRMVQRFLSCLSGVGLLLLSYRAAAYEVVVTADTMAQGYELRSPWGEPVIARRRFTQTLGLQVAHFGQQQFDTSDSLDVTFRMRLRVDADLGVGSQEFHAEPSSEAFVPGLYRQDVDIMYAYADVRGIADGLMSARLGRQYLVDSLGWWSMDGARATMRLPIYLRLSGYGGFEQRGGLPLSSPRFEAEGVWRGNRTGWESQMYPSMLSAGVAPAWGVAIDSVGLPIVHMGAAYRKVWNTAPATIDLLPMAPGSPLRSIDDTRVSTERAAFSFDANVGEWASTRAGATYDFGRAVVSSAFGGVEVDPVSWATVSADVDRVVPTFDYDSIWSFFAAEPMTTATLRTVLSISKSVDVFGSGGGRVVDDLDGGWDKLGRAGARWRGPMAAAGISAMVDRGRRGGRMGGDCYGTVALGPRLRGRLDASLYDWRDELHPERSATSVGYSLGGTYRIQRTSALMLEWEHNMNRIVGNQYRVLAMLRVMVTK